MADPIVGGRGGRVVDVTQPTDVAPLPPPLVATLHIDAPRNTTLKLTRRKGNTSTQILLTVNKNQKVFWDGAEV